MPRGVEVRVLFWAPDVSRKPVNLTGFFFVCCKCIWPNRFRHEVPQLSAAGCTRKICIAISLFYNSAFVAQMAKLVDALVSGTSAARRGGSSPLLGTRYFGKAGQIDRPFCIVLTSNLLTFLSGLPHKSVAIRKGRFSKLDQMPKG